jgi:hypothetical protein
LNTDEVAFKANELEDDGAIGYAKGHKRFARCGNFPDSMSVFHVLFFFNVG